MEPYPFNFEVGYHFTKGKYGKIGDDCRTNDTNKAVHGGKLGQLVYPGHDGMVLHLNYSWGELIRHQGFLEYKSLGGQRLKSSAKETIPYGKSELFVQMTKQLRMFERYVGLGNHEYHSFEIMSATVPYITKKMLTKVASNIERRIQRQLNIYFEDEVMCEVTSDNVGIVNQLILHVYEERLEHPDNVKNVREIFMSLKQEFKDMLIREEKEERRNKATNPDFSFSILPFSVLEERNRLSRMSAEEWDGKEFLSVTHEGYTIGIEFQKPRRVDAYGSREYRFNVFTMQFGKRKKSFASVEKNITVDFDTLIRELSPYCRELLGIDLFGDVLRGSYHPDNEFKILNELFTKYGDSVEFHYQTEETDTSIESLLFATQASASMDDESREKLKFALKDVTRKALELPPF